MIQLKNHITKSTPNAICICLQMVNLQKLITLKGTRRTLGCLLPQWMPTRRQPHLWTHVITEFTIWRDHKGGHMWVAKLVLNTGTVLTSAEHANNQFGGVLQIIAYIVLRPSQTIFIQGKSHPAFYTFLACLSYFLAIWPTSTRLKPKIQSWVQICTQRFGLISITIMKHQ